MNTVIVWGELEGRSRAEEPLRFLPTYPHAYNSVI